MRAEAAAARWIRPPFAAPELEFLLACTRCSACLEACPHGVLFRLPSRVGALAAGTPALDLLNRACHLCAHWPCVTACGEAGGEDADPAALRPLDLRWKGGGEPGAPSGYVPVEPAEEKSPFLPPPFARLHVDRSRCLPWSGPECGACADACPIPGALRWEGTRPDIDPGRCVGCGLCREACILDPPAVRVDGPVARQGI